MLFRGSLFIQVLEGSLEGPCFCVGDSLLRNEYFFMIQLEVTTCQFVTLHRDNSIATCLSPLPWWNLFFWCLLFLLFASSLGNSLTHNFITDLCYSCLFFCWSTILQRPTPRYPYYHQFLYFHLVLLLIPSNQSLNFRSSLRYKFSPGDAINTTKALNRSLSHWVPIIFNRMNSPHSRVIFD